MTRYDLILEELTKLRDEIAATVRSVRESQAKTDRLLRAAKDVYESHTISGDLKTAIVHEPLMYVLGAAISAMENGEVPSARG